MPTSNLLKYSKQELVRLLESSVAIANMDKTQRELLNTVIARATEDQLIDLFAILRNERQFLDKTEQEFKRKIC